jgi:raffinose/stachyose/melibiose transport system permease protein
MKAGWKKKSFSVFRMVLLLCAVLCVTYPFFLLLLTSLKTKKEYLDIPVSIPRAWTFINYLRVFKTAKILRSFLNSAVLAAASTAGELAAGSAAAYALSKMRFLGKKAFTLGFLFPLFLPIQNIIIPLYILYKELKLINTLHGLIIIYTACGLPLVILMLRNFMRTIPASISEAALLDGLAHFGLYTRIVIPLLQPILAVVIIISSLSVWNDFYLPLIMLTDEKLATLPLRTYMFSGQYRTDWTKICTCIVFLAAPVIVFYSFMQKQIIGEITHGAITG